MDKTLHLPPISAGRPARPGGDTPAKSRAWPLVTLIGLFVLVVMGRAVFVSLYSESIPFWDQWGAEGLRLLKPWFEGRLSPSALFAPHNEHRILLTRLISLALFEANNHQWDNLVAAYANTVIYAAIPASLFVLLRPGLRTHASRAILFVALLALAWLPYAWENTRIGFQNQFFLMSLLAILCIWAAAKASDGLRSKLLPLLPAILGIFTMASGILGPVAAGGVLVLRMLLGQLRLPTTAAIVVLLAVVSALGFAAIPHVPNHDIYKAQSAAEWLKHVLFNLGWPLSGAPLAWLVVWSPTMLAAWRLFRSRQADSRELLALGLAAWTLLQAAAIAYSRGQLSPRYLDTMSVGLVANLWLWLRSIERWRVSSRRHKAISAVSGCLFLMACIAGFIRSTPGDLKAAEENARLSTTQILHVRSFVATGDRAFLDDKPALAIPYPWPKKLALLLSDPTLRAILPASIRAPLPMTADAAAMEVRTSLGNLGRRISSCPDGEKCLEATGRWRSTALTSPFPYLQWPVTVEGGTEGIAIGLVPAEGGAERTDLPSSARLRQRMFLSVPGAKPFALEISDMSSTTAFLADGPVEAGFLSKLAMQLQDRVRILAGRPTSDSLQRDRMWLPAPGANGERRALSLPPGLLAQIEWTMPRTGRLSGIAVLIGNYGRTSDGKLAVQACSEDRCQSAQSNLRDSIDNQHIELMFPSPLALRAGDPLVLKFWTHQSTPPVAFWVEGPVAGSASIRYFGKIPPAELRDASPPLALILSD